jgi:hypothetical protein
MESLSICSPAMSLPHNFPENYTTSYHSRGISGAQNSQGNCGAARGINPAPRVT